MGVAFPLESTLRNHGVGTQMSAPLLARMYKIAVDGFTKAATVPDYLVSVLVTDKAVLSSVTEAKSGLWLQLARLPTGTVLLTVGQKWATEQPDSTQHNVATKIW